MTPSFLIYVVVEDVACYMRYHLQFCFINKTFHMPPLMIIKVIIFGDLSGQACGPLQLIQ